MKRIALGAFVATLLLSCGGAKTDSKSAPESEADLTPIVLPDTSDYDTANHPLLKFSWTGDFSANGHYSLWLEADTCERLIAGKITISGSDFVKTTKPLLVVGNVAADNPNSYFAQIFDASGYILGQLTIADAAGNTSGDISLGLDESRKMTFQKAAFPNNAPNLLDKDFFPSCSAHYAYDCSRPDSRDDGYGGDATIYVDTTNDQPDIRFYISCVMPNIAEGNNFFDKAARSKGNSFDYSMPNCRYAFRARMYSRFMVITQIGGDEQSDCFGANASFDGIYIRTADNFFPIWLWEDPAIGKAIYVNSYADGFDPKAYSRRIVGDEVKDIAYLSRQTATTPDDATLTGNFSRIGGYVFKTPMAKGIYPRMVLAATDAFVKDNQFLSLGTKPKITADEQKEIQKKYGRTIKHAEGLASIDDNGKSVRVFSVQFADEKGKKPLAAVIVFNGEEIASIDYPATVFDDGTYAWNVDDEGSFIAPEIVAAANIEYNPNARMLNLYYCHRAPESVTVGRIAVADDKAVDLIDNSFYYWYE